MIASRGYAAPVAGTALAPFAFERRDPGPDDVLMEVLFCGICHSDVHMVDNDWGFALFPIVPGHEIVGRVTRVGARVTKLAPGDLAAVGCMIDSCRVCSHCQSGLEQYCDSYPTSSFSSYERGTRNLVHGGFSSNYVVDERFALKVPASLDPATAAPLLCAGITTYSPLRHWNVAAGSRVGIVGLGGLGHVAVQFARALGAEVTVITGSAGKSADAHGFGAHEVIVSTDSNQMARGTGRLDFILDTVSADHDVASLLNLLRTDGTLCMVGIPRSPLAIPAMLLEARRKRIAGSGMGGLPETQEMLDFAAVHRIGATIELIRMEQVNDAFRRLRNNDVRYRFVIDMATLD